MWPFALTLPVVDIRPLLHRPPSPLYVGPATVTPTTAPPTPGPATETPSTEPPTTAAPTTVAPTTAPPTTAPPTAGEQISGCRSSLALAVVRSVQALLLDLPIGFGSLHSPHAYLVDQTSFSSYLESGVWRIFPVVVVVFTLNLRVGIS